MIFDSTTRRRIRTRISATARTLGILQSLDGIRYARIRTKNLIKNRQFTRTHPSVATPPPHLAYDAYSTVDWPYYYEAGQSIARKLATIIQEFLKPGALHFLEWGCGPACVIRHIPALLPRGSKIFGCDYNKETIGWCRKTFPGIRFEENELVPPLIFDSSEFDWVCGLSVLTHLSDATCRAWLQELARVTKPGGIIFLTTKGDSHMFRLSEAERREIRNGRAVVRGNIQEGKRLYDTILPADHMRRIMPPTLAIVRHTPNGIPEYQQDLWVLRRI